MNAVDTNVFVYAIDFNEPSKQTKARDLLKRLSESLETVLLWQVVGEYLNVFDGLRQRIDFRQPMLKPTCTIC